MTVEAGLHETPLTDVHRSLGARMIDFGGWLMPVQYRGIVEEHRAVRERAGLAGEQVEAVLSVDSTIVRAHQHAAGARRDSVFTGPAPDTGGRIESQEFSGRARGAA